MRKLILVALSCSVFGGCIGALATAATQSQASPKAIAAAVQQVNDQQANRTLETISGELRTTTNRLSDLSTKVSTNSQLKTIQNSLKTISQEGTSLTTLGQEFYGDGNDSIREITHDLYAICENTNTGIGLAVCAGG